MKLSNQHSWQSYRNDKLDELSYHVKNDYLFSNYQKVMSKKADKSARQLKYLDSLTEYFNRLSPARLVPVGSHANSSLIYQKKFNKQFYQNRASNQRESEEITQSDKDSYVVNQLKNKEIQRQSQLEQRKKQIEACEERWQAHRRWLSTIFIIWFLVACALLINAFHY